MQVRQDEIRQWERDWREAITGQMQDTTKIARDTALVVREMQGDVKDLMAWKADQEKRKSDKQDKAPESRRADWALYISGAMAIFYIVTFIMQHWRP